MSGKGEGKKHNRAAQSQQHGFQEQPEEKAGMPSAGESPHQENHDRQRVLEKLRDLEERRHQKNEG